jgi:hypothetical protein
MGSLPWSHLLKGEIEASSESPLLILAVVHTRALMNCQSKMTSAAKSGALPREIPEKQGSGSECGSLAWWC